MVKYTGYGNAVGLLANRGLLLGGKPQGDYRSDSDESETEEYSNLKETKINPITGRWEQHKASPMEGMTEEQKAYEAIKLVQAMNKLQRGEKIQSSTIGPEGKPKPVEHILELTSNMDNMEISEETEND